MYNRDINTAELHKICNNDDNVPTNNCKNVFFCVQLWKRLDLALMWRNAEGSLLNASMLLWKDEEVVVDLKILESLKKSCYANNKNFLHK